MESSFVKGRPRTALIVDYAGVMTTPYMDSLRAWMLADGLDPQRCSGFMHDLAKRSVDEVEGPMHGLETGTWSAADFERALAEEMAEAGLGTVLAEGLLSRMFAGLAPDHAMADAVGKARAAGVRTALLSNSFGLEYPREDWDRLFDVTVISGASPLRREQPPRLLGRGPGRCRAEMYSTHAAGSLSLRHVQMTMRSGRLAATGTSPDRFA